MEFPKNVNHILSQFTGTECHYLHPSGFRYSDGIKFLATTYECYWLIDDIFIYNCFVQNLKAHRDYQVWNLERISNNQFRLIATDGNKVKLFQTEIPYSDFNGDRVTLWFEYGVLIVPSEH